MTSLIDTNSFLLPRNQQAATVWNSGGRNYDRISRQIADAIEHCIDRLNPRVGEKVLDVATGTGWTARRAAARGASVTGIDFSTEAIETARALDSSRGIDFQVGDAESLPYSDAEFDAVTSTFGVMFCGAPDIAADELARVCKPGGKLALAIWDTKGGVFDMFRIVSKYKPIASSSPPSPFAWASEERLQQLLGHAFDLQVERAVSYYREPTAEDAWDAFATSYGPIKTLYSNLEPQQAAALKTDFIEFHRQHTTGAGILVPRDYLIVVGARK